MAVANYFVDKVGIRKVAVVALWAKLVAHY